jgi:hypothetical protein
MLKALVVDHRKHLAKPFPPDERASADRSLIRC